MNTVLTEQLQQNQMQAHKVQTQTRNRPAALKENLIAFFDRQGWKYKVLGRAEMPQSIAYVGNWVIVPSDADVSKIPDNAMDKVTAILAEGYRPKGFLLAHEITPNKARQRPKTAFSIPQSNWFEEKAKARKTVSFPVPDWSKLTRYVSPVVSVLGELTKIAVICAGVALGVLALISIIKALLVVGGVILGLVVLAAGAGLDPVLVVVSDDNYWIEIDRWVE